VQIFPENIVDTGLVHLSDWSDTAISWLQTVLCQTILTCCYRS